MRLSFHQRFPGDARVKIVRAMLFLYACTIVMSVYIVGRCRVTEHGNRVNYLVSVKSARRRRGVAFRMMSAAVLWSESVRTKAKNRHQHRSLWPRTAVTTQSDNASKEQEILDLFQ